MINVALIFPGQGAQKVGMGKELYDASPQSREVFDAADRVLGIDLTKTIFEGPAEKLTSTAYCQPAILTMSIAALAALRVHPKSKNISVKFAAGLSLGEYSALIAAGALGLEAGLRLVQHRAGFMEEATKLERGAMAAVIGFPKEKLLVICQETGAQIANFNSPEQIVITGHAAKVQAACERLKAEGAKTVIPLEVSGAFHSSLMAPAAEKFSGVLKGAAIQKPQIPIVANVNAAPQTDPSAIRRLLAEQITSSVQWEPSVRFLASQGVTEFLEIGPGKVLKGLMRKTDPALKVHNIEVPTDLENLPF